MQNSSNDIIISNEEFNDQKTEKILAQTVKSESQIGVCAGPLEIGPVSTPFSYFDEAGRFYKTNSNHSFQNSITAKNVNIPDSQNHQSIVSVGKRFMR